MAQTGLAATSYRRSDIAKIIARAKEYWPLALWIGAQLDNNFEFYKDLAQCVLSLQLEKVSPPKFLDLAAALPNQRQPIMEMYGLKGGPWVAWALQRSKEWYYDNPGKPLEEWPRPDISQFKGNTREFEQSGNTREFEQSGAPGCVFVLNPAGCTRLNCQFNHDPEVIEELRQKLKMQPCKEFLTPSGCRHGDTCLYSHDKVPEL